MTSITTSHLDIIVVNFISNNASILLGYGNGSFANQTTYPTGTNPASVAVGDFNNDTLPDIVICDLNDNAIDILLHSTRGTLLKEITFASGGGSLLRYAVADDFNNDGQLDIIVANYGTNNIGVLFGYGNGTFQTQMMSTSGSKSHPSAIAVGNIN